ncbi:phytoene desaturase family protein [Arthrobacter sp. H14-L1]|uniref:phytoene desaturase family protein n=1 Tax=Arthrobacter sp. H14-L1 TaxID=2996697 RepID=UPI002272096D|nr:phytoene desaturase family protein [Arthrobacter sp. H14-L1]MCY0903685.1 phytoene desaturase family protein [Arthrobacter sp. H14-L1]
MTGPADKTEKQGRRKEHGARRRVVVIGGGISGLATAALLARSGHHVTLLEQQDAVGGRAGRWEEDGFVFDTGPSWYLMPEVFDHYFSLLGTTAADQLRLVKLNPAYRVFFENDPVPVDVPAGRRNVVDLFESLEQGAGDKLEKYLTSAEQTYTLALRHFLYTSFQSFRTFLRPEVLLRLPKLVRLLLQPLDSFAASYVRDPRLRQILGYPAVFLGASPSTAPSMFHLMSHLDLTDGVLYPMGGLYEVINSIEQLAREEGVRICTAATATQILTSPSGRTRCPARVSGVRYTAVDGQSHDLPADIVVGAADLHHVETQLLPERLQTYPQRYWDRRISGPGAVLICLGVEGQLPQLQHHTLLFSTDWTENFKRIFGATPSIPEPPSLYICKPSATDPSVSPAGTENLFVLVPIPADPTFGHGGVDGAGERRVEELADAVIAQISGWAGIDDLAERIRVRRTFGPGDFVSDLNSWQGGALGPAHVLRQSAFFRSGNVSKKVDGLIYAGSSTIPGIGLPMCLISAEIALKRLNGDVSSGPLPEPLAPDPLQRGSVGTR